MEQENKKKGFWASLFSPRKQTCCCGGSTHLRPDTAAPHPTNAAHVVKVLGTGCAKCKTTLALVQKVVQEQGLDMQVLKVEDIEQILRYNVLATPALVVDGEVKMSGRVPNEQEIKRMLGAE